MEKVRPWCGQPSDRGRLRNRTEQEWERTKPRTLGYGSRPLSRPHCVRWDPAPLQKGHSSPPPSFWPMSIVAAVAHLSYCWALVWLSTYGVHIGVTWQIWLNRSCAAAMWPYVKFLWPLVAQMPQSVPILYSGPLFTPSKYGGCGPHPIRGSLGHRSPQPKWCLNWLKMICNDFLVVKVNRWSYAFNIIKSIWILRNIKK